MSNETKNFYGLDGIEFIWHGEWADPEVEYEGRRFNYYDLEDPLWEIFREERETECQPVNEDEFPGWVRQNRALAIEILENLMSPA